LHRYFLKEQISKGLFFKLRILINRANKIVISLYKRRETIENLKEQCEKSTLILLNDGADFHLVANRTNKVINKVITKLKLK